MKNKKVVIWLGLFLLVCAGSMGAISDRQYRDANKFSLVSEEVLPKTVMIMVEADVEQVSLVINNGRFEIEKATVPVVIRGAGVFISPNGHVLTCAHLFWAARIKNILITDYAGYTEKVDFIDKNDDQDLALLKSWNSSHFDYAVLASPRSLKVGQEVLAVGNPLGYEFSVSHGIISALNREIDSLSATQSDTFLNPGNSGGPLFNLAGELIGINSRIYPPVRAPIFTGLGFSVSPKEIGRFLEKFRGL